jgi:peptide/nickel transport system substrate-binding protein
MIPSAPMPQYEKNWFASRNFRLAISHAVRREDLCRIAYRGRAAPGIGPFPPANLFWFKQNLKPHAWDPELSRRLLAQDGFRIGGGALRDRAGHAVEFSLITNAGNQARERVASLLQQDLQALGIRLRIVTLDFPSLLERITKTFQYESCLLAFNNVELDPDSQMSLWLSSSSNHAWNPKQPSPATAWEAEIDRLMRRQASDPDAKRRKQQFDRVQQIVWDEAPLLYLVNRNALMAISPKLRGVQPSVLYPRVIWNIDQIHFEGAR